MKSYTNRLGLAAMGLSLVMLAGCASSGRVDAVEATANSAMSTAESAQQSANDAMAAANAAMRAAERAQATADQALRAANDANAAITRLAETISSK